jgi:HD-like signal output (HDOD) protein
MPLVGFEPTLQAFERAKRILALDRVATVIGINDVQNLLYNLP